VRGRALGGLVIAAVVAAAGLLSAQDEAPLSVRITSPLGRTGVAGAVRIVARVEHGENTQVQLVRFFVNKAPVGEDAQGPVYAVEWVDDNPFVAAEISVEVVDTKGRAARDRVALKAFDFVETAEVLSVLVEATVNDKEGRFVAGIDRSGFELREDDVPQQLEVVRPETLAATYVLLVDGSQSMARRVDFLREAAARLMRHLHQGDRVLVVPFTKSLGAITGPTTDAATVGDALAAVQARGGTAICDALVATTRYLEGREGRHVIVLLSDGYDEHSKSTANDAIAALQQRSATVYVIGIGGVAGISLKGERLLKRIAEETGGRAFFPWRESELPVVHDRVASDVANRYVLTYTPLNQKVDGTFRKIQLKTTEPGLTVRAKPGYFAPKPPPVRPTLEFTVVDTTRQYLDLTREDLVVIEDGVPQRVDAFFEANAPVSLFLVIDESGSMRRSADGVKAAARSFVNALRDQDKLAVIRFADRPVLAHDLTLFRSDATKAIDEYAPNGGTALYDAINDALGRLKRVEGRRVVVAMTDGRDENNAGTEPGSVLTFSELLANVKDADALVYLIGLGSNVDRERLEQIATETGGEAYFPATIEALSDDYARIVENLRRRYVISYESTNTKRDGAWRDVAIQSSRSELRFASRGGYFAPAR
jgi:Ca-activated chloride channel family protein